jgi:hypothetical protein
MEPYSLRSYFLKRYTPETLFMRASLGSIPLRHPDVQEYPVEDSLVKDCLIGEPLLRRNYACADQLVCDT